MTRNTRRGFGIGAGALGAGLLPTNLALGSGWSPEVVAEASAAVAGGFTYRAVTNRFSIVRTSNKQAETTEGGAGRETFVQPGDVITVFERVF